MPARHFIQISRGSPGREANHFFLLPFGIPQALLRFTHSSSSSRTMHPVFYPACLFPCQLRFIYANGMIREMRRGKCETFPNNVLMPDKILGTPLSLPSPRPLVPLPGKWRKSLVVSPHYETESLLPSHAWPMGTVKIRLLCLQTGNGRARWWHQRQRQRRLAGRKRRRPATCISRRGARQRRGVSDRKSHGFNATSRPFSVKRIRASTDRPFYPETVRTCCTPRACSGQTFQCGISGLPRAERMQTNGQIGIPRRISASPASTNTITT